MSIIFATGPKVDAMTREAAIEAAKANPQFPKNADDISVEELDGHWVAAIHVADNPFGGPADQTDDAPGPKSEGPGDTKPEIGDDVKDEAAEEGESPEHEQKEKEEGDTDDDGKKDKGGESHKIDALFDAVQKILVALGIPDTEGDEGLIPGEEPPEGPPGPEAGPPVPPEPEEVHHEKALKPGEVGPGQTPVGAPAFSSVNPIIARGEKHPWENLIGVAATFEVEERVPDHYSATDVDEELREVAYGTGFKVKQAQVKTDENGRRIAKALISAY